MRRISPLLVAGVLAIAGCGSSSEPSTSSFKKAFAAQKAKLKQLGTEVGSAVEGASKQSDNVLVGQFEGLASRATVLAGALGQLDAPAKYKSELATLQSAITQVAGALHSIEAAAAAHDAAAAKAGGEVLVADAQQVKSSDNALSAKLGLPTSP
jgi:hypothetical protein